MFLVRLCGQLCADFRNRTIRYPLQCFGSYNPERSTSIPRHQTGVRAHNKPHDITSNTTDGYSAGDLRWLVIYMWLFKSNSHWHCHHLSELYLIIVAIYMVIFHRADVSWLLGHLSVVDVS